MGCIRSKTREFENSIQSTSTKDQNVEINEITDICDSLVEFIATVEMPDYSAQPFLLESPQPAEREDDPGASCNTREALPLHEPESSEPAEDENRDRASPNTFIWLSFDATVEIPVIMDITEEPVNICVATNVYEPPVMPTLLDAEAPECDAGMSSNIGQSQEQTDAEPEDDTKSTFSSLPLGVFLAEHKETRQVCAIKALKKTRIVEQKDLESVFKEKEILQTINCSEHPFLVSFYGTFQTNSHLFYVMEYLPGGDMFEFITCGELEEQDVMFYSACVVLGLEALHQIGIVHRDLKLENLLMDQEGFVKIVDFGLSKKGFGYSSRTKTKCGTRAYMAPEVYMNIGYGMAVDWWALGIAIYAMLMYELPFNNKDPFELADSILYDEIEFPEDLSEDVCGLMNELLVKDPEYRLGSGEAGADDVKGHPFFRDMDWKNLKNRRVRPPFVPANQGHLESLMQPEARAPALTLPSVEITSEQQEAFREFDFTL
ncbi:hypothetical protein XELAEV_18011644mg [Xenopus laevis]|uniref:Protein kinase domain-containing protein n=1 Tax=Xenopus laevis TaxID=8355 RepID=A0A974DNI4_XENLA|nr:hypothetical protein XELAEV_18011644mg [Xenopus laevis]